MRCIVCRDGIIVSDKTENVGVGDGNLIIMDPMIVNDVDESEIIGEMMEQISLRFPQVSIDFKAKI